MSMSIAQPGFVPTRNAEGAQMVNKEAGSPSYGWGGLITLAANPTDVLSVMPSSEARSLMIKRLSIRLLDDSGSSSWVPVSALLRASNTGGTSTFRIWAKRDAAMAGASGALYTYSANPTALGAGDSPIAYDLAQINGAPLVFDFTVSGLRPPTLRSLFDGAFSRTFALNLGGAAFGTNPRAVINIEAGEEAVRKILLVGDSLYSNATGAKVLASYLPGLFGQADLRFYGSNGKRLIDFLPTAEANVAGLTYGPGTTISSLPSYDYSIIQPDIVCHYLTNDVRTGAITLAEAIARLDAFIQLIRFGCVSGQTFTSTISGTPRAFVWNQTLYARPNARIWLMTPNSYLSDDPSAAGYITNTGTIAGANLAAAAQNATDMAWNAYMAFAGDPRLNGGQVLDCQNYVSPSTGLSFGRVVRTAANNPLMTDTLHPNPSWGQIVKMEQIAGALGLR